VNPYYVILTAWDWEPSVIVGCIGLLVLYYYAVQPKRPLRTISYTTGVLVLFLALVSPIDTLSDQYLFSVHMIQHLLLILAVPPLMIAGLPKEFVNRILRVPWVRRTEQVLSKPLIAWTSATFFLAFWHIPIFYNFALAHEGVHILEHLIFLVTSTIFWWPVLAPVRGLRMNAGMTVFYLFTASLFNAVLGMIITFAPLGIYPAYIHPQDSLGILTFIRQSWGISAKGDQQLGGLLMWVPAGLVYFTAIVSVVTKWQSETNEDDELQMTEARAYMAGGRDAA
jgi:cytochrome c oxidase assembly factor CtaG